MKYIGTESIDKSMTSKQMNEVSNVHTFCLFQRDAFLRLYSYYCQNSPRSERLRETVGEKNMFFQACQLKLGHKLPLAAYLLKPVQRLTKYQLLLKVVCFISIFILSTSTQGSLLH
jgi:hypothetical protein